MAVLNQDKSIPVFEVFDISMHLSARVDSGTQTTEENACNCSLFVLSAVSNVAKDSSRLDGKEWEGQVPNLRVRNDWVVKQSILILFGFAEHGYIQIFTVVPLLPIPVWQKDFLPCSLFILLPAQPFIV